MRFCIGFHIGLLALLLYDGNSSVIQLERTENQVIELTMEGCIAQFLHSQNSLLLLIVSFSGGDKQEFQKSDSFHKT